MDITQPLPRLLRHVSQKQPFLFVGCSLNGDRTVRVLHHVARDYPELAHYAIIEMPPSGSELVARDKFLSDHGIRPIWYPSGKHEFVAILLERLAGVRSRQHPPTQSIETPLPPSPPPAAPSPAAVSPPAPPPPTGGIPTVSLPDIAIRTQRSRSEGEHLTGGPQRIVAAFVCGMAVLSVVALGWMARGAAASLLPTNEPQRHTAPAARSSPNVLGGTPSPVSVSENWQWAANENDDGSISIFRLGLSDAPERPVAEVRGRRVPTTFAVNDDGTLLALSHEGDIELRTLQSGQEVAGRGWHQKDPVSAMTFNPDGSTLAVGTSAGIVRLVHTRTMTDTGALMGAAGDAPLHGVDALAFTHDGRKVAVGSLWSGAVRVYDATSRQVLQNLRMPQDDAHSLFPSQITFDQSGARLAVGNGRGGASASGTSALKSSCAGCRASRGRCAPCPLLPTVRWLRQLAQKEALPSGARPTVRSWRP